MNTIKIICKEIIYAIFPNRYKSSDISAILKDDGIDHKGRTYHDYLNMPDFWLEHCHDYVQYMFPTDKSSKRFTAPVITMAEAVILGKNPVVRDNLCKASKKMLNFYRKNNAWITPNNHNFLRISRILRSLRMFGMHNEAEKFYGFAMHEAKLHPDVIDDTTKRFWEENNRYCRD